MLKVRLMGTREEIMWYKSILNQNKKLKVIEFSNLYQIKGSTKYYRVYVEIIKMED